MDKHPNSKIIGGLAILGALSSTLSVFQAIYGFYKGDFGNFNLFLISCLLTIIALAAICAYLSIRNMYLYKDFCKAPAEIEKLQKRNSKLVESIQHEREIQYKIAKTFHNFSHEYRSQIRAIHVAFHKQDPSQFSDLQSSFKHFLIYTIENIKEAFDFYTKTDCSVCIKLLDEKLDVKTFLRDSVSLRTRQNASKKLTNGYYYKENTAFYTILDTPNTFFLHNNLKSLKGAGQYTNANQAWQEHYNACLVVPIRIINGNAQNDEDFRVIGFICVDNFKGNFDSKTCVDMLASYADHCFNLFSLYFRYAELANGYQKA